MVKFFFVGLSEFPGAIKMKKKIILLFNILLILLLINTAPAAVIEQVIRFDQADFQFSKIEQYDIITMKNLELQFEIGKPQLPFKLIHLAIPNGKKVAGVEIINKNQETLSKEFLIFPCQPPQTLSSIEDNSEIKLIKPDLTVYQSDSPYPKQVVSYLNTGEIQDKQVASFAVYPVQYLPKQKKILFHSEIQFRVLLENQEYIPQFEAAPADDGYLKLIDNPASFQKITAAPTDEQYPYIIITSKTMKAHFQPLADWKTQKGVRAKIVDLSWIKINFTGRDDAEKIRSFIQYAYQNWGTKWILLGGDTNIVPQRTAFAMDCEYGNNKKENHIPCDLYFADLDGDWDANGNNIFGEIADDIDLFPEVYVGRASLDSPDEVDAWVNKILTYEKNPPTDYQKNILFACQLLWSVPYTDTGIGKNMIEELNFLPNFYNITKLYESSGNLTKAGVIQKINQGQNIINHDGHAWWSLMSVGDGTIGVSDMYSLNNGARTGTIFSIGCWPAAIDYDCVAEAFIANANGGGVAFIGNSRYGWGSPGNPGFGYSDRYDDKFFHFLFKEKCYSVGKALALAKAYYAPFSRQENVYRWCMYEINLLGDPEMPVWTDIPQNLSVEYPSEINVGNSLVTITATNEGLPLNNSRICLIQGETIYQTAITSNEGQAQFSVTTEDAVNNIQLTVTAPNYLSYQGSIAVQTTEAYLACCEVILNDNMANADGILNPGETAYLNLKIKNYGAASAESALISLKSDSSKLKVLTGEFAFDYISSLDSVKIENAFQIAADTTCSNGDVFYPQLTISAYQGVWNEKIAVSIGTPVIKFYNLTIKDDNENQIIEAGENIQISLFLKNQGLAPAENIQAQIFSNDLYLTLPQQVLNFGNLLPAETAVDSFSITVSETCPVLHFPALVVRGTYGAVDSFKTECSISIGNLGFYDDLESSAYQWKLQDKYTNSWHKSRIRKHSGSISWYCGQEADTTYLNDNNSILLSPLFNLGQDAEITFWLWYDVAIYSKNGYEGDGVHVEFFDGNVWQELDFIGTGGALPPILMGNDWLEYKYNFSCVPANNARLKFKFVSDPFSDKYPDKHEGIYIDDIKVTCSMASSVKQTEPISVPKDFELSQNYPNPFNSTTVIKYKISESVKNSPVLIQIYNLLGQKVKTLVNDQKPPGNYQVLWNGTNDNEQMVSSGIYLCFMKVKNQFNDVKKVILLE